jgi:hypothetical protein
LARKAPPRPPSWIERMRRRPGLPRNSRFIWGTPQPNQAK